MTGNRYTIMEHALKMAQLYRKEYGIVTYSMGLKCEWDLMQLYTAENYRIQTYIHT